jgi:DNA helicase-2/ATP-dependent DNA helicase PcrA
MSTDRTTSPPEGAAGHRSARLGTGLNPVPDRAARHPTTRTNKQSTTPGSETSSQWSLTDERDGERTARLGTGLNPEQRRAVEAPNAPLLIVAGAGTGKTRTLTSRIIHLVARGVPPASICAITFTNKAAKEMADRIRDANDTNPIRIPRMKNSRHSDARLPDGQVFVDSHRDSPYIGTFHSLGARILRAEAALAGRTRNFVIFDEQDSLRLMKQVLRGAETAKEDGGPAFFLRRVSELKNGVRSPEELTASPNVRDRRALAAYERYEAELAKNDAFDFDDLIEKTLRLFRDHPEALERYQQRFRYILVDEYQDLNNTQYELVRLLAGSTRHVSVVGDDQQMIYGWRFANLDIFLNFERDWPGAQVLLLEENYRSTSTIITAASALIAQNRRQKPKTLRTRNEAGNPIDVFEATDEEDEAAWVAERIRTMTNDNNDDSVYGHRHHHGHGPSTAVLYRTNAQSRAVEQALIERGIQYRIFGGFRFYERQEVKDVVAALRYATNPRDLVSRDRLEKLLGRNRFAATKDGLRSRATGTPLTLVQYFLEQTGYLDYLDRNFENAADRRENVAELIRFAAQFELATEFLERMSLLQPTDTTQEDRGKRIEEGMVQLMTIHLAKGLEFDRVFVVGCAEGLLPHARSMESEAEIEEERRLMYVAMTRARRELALSFSDIPSRFLFELPPDLVRFESSTSDATALEDDEERYITID